MGSSKVEPRALPQFLADLEEQGALNVRRGRAGFDGRVPVTWDEPGDPPMTDEEYRQNMLAYMPVYVLSALFAALIVGIVVIMEVFGG